MVQFPDTPKVTFFGDIKLPETHLCICIRSTFKDRGFFLDPEIESIPETSFIKTITDLFISPFTYYKNTWHSVVFENAINLSSLILRIYSSDHRDIGAISRFNHVQQCDPSADK